MKTIIQENHYQKKKWEEANFQRDLQSGRLKNLIGDESELEKRRTESLAEAKRKWEEREASLRTMPSLVGRLKFKIASRLAVAVARHYAMDVHIQSSGARGMISLACDEIMFDIIWKDSPLKRRFLLLFLFANRSCIEWRKEGDDTFLAIWLSYELEHEFFK